MQFGFPQKHIIWSIQHTRDLLRKFIGLTPMEEKRRKQGYAGSGGMLFWDAASMKGSALDLQGSVS